MSLFTSVSSFASVKVNTSGQFVGMAEMMGPVDFDQTLEYWQQDKWQGCFPVKWQIIKDVQNSSLRHIKLSNNDNKPVTNSRDTQEVGYSCHCFNITVTSSLPYDCHLLRRCADRLNSMKEFKYLRFSRMPR